MTKSKPKFELKFDENAVMAEIKDKDLYSLSALAGAKFQHAQDSAVVNQLIKIIEMQRERLNYVAKSIIYDDAVRSFQGLNIYANRALAETDKMMEALNE